MKKFKKTIAILFFKIFPIEEFIHFLINITSKLCTLVFYRDWVLLMYGQPQFFKQYINLYTWNKNPKNFSFTFRGFHTRQLMFKDCVLLLFIVSDSKID